MRGYYVDEIEATWLGLDLKEGLADGTMIAPARANPTYSQKEQANGKVIRSRRPGTSGTLTLTVNQASDLHRELLKKYQQDRATEDQVGPMVIKDIASGLQTTFKNAYIQTSPDVPYAMEDSDLSWVFGYESEEYSGLDDNTNFVGN